MFQRGCIKLFIEVVRGKNINAAIISAYPDIIMIIFVKSIYRIMAETIGRIVLMYIVAPFVFGKIIAVKPSESPYPYITVDIFCNTSNLIIRCLLYTSDAADE